MSSRRQTPATATSDATHSPGPAACPRRGSFGRTLALGVALAFGGLVGPVCAATADAVVPGELLLKLKSTTQLQPLLSRYPLTLVASLGARPLYRLKVTGATDPRTVAEQLLKEPGVQFAETHAINQAPEARKNIAWAIGTASQYVAQWGLDELHLAQAQALSTGAGQRVAVLDTGVDYSHPALAARLLPGRDFVDGDTDASEGGSGAEAAFGHGTHVAGLVALAAPGARILPLRVLDAQGAGSVWAIAQALLYAVDPDGNPQTPDGATVINLSLGTLDKTNLFTTLAHLVNCNPPAPGAALDLSDPGYNDDKQRCRNGAAAVLVAAAGNDGSAKVKQFPAAESAYGLLSVAASASNHRPAPFSNTGGWIAAAAPGEGLTSAFPGNRYATWSGTSMAAPLAAGTAALLRAREPALTPRQIVERLEATAAPLCGNSKLVELDAWAALNNLPAPPLNCR